jgi:hypothetical protein
MSYPLLDGTIQHQHQLGNFLNNLQQRQDRLRAFAKTFQNIQWDWEGQRKYWSLGYARFGP